MPVRVIARPNIRHAFRLVVVAVVLLALPYAVTSTSYYLRVATLILLYGALGVAWNIVGGYAGQVSLGHAAFFGLGAYSSTLLLREIGLTPWLGMVVGGLVAVVAAMLIGFPVFRLQGHFYALATLAFAEILRTVFLYLRDLTGGAVGLTVPFVRNSLKYMQFSNGRPYYYIALTLAVLCVGVSYLIDQGRLGYYLRAVRANEKAASAVGVDVFRIKMTASAISAFLTALLGSFYAQFHYFIDPDTVFGVLTISVKMALVAIIGGLGHPWGPMLGAAVLIPLDEWTNAILTGGLAAVGRLVYGVLLVTLVLFQPQGLVRWTRRLWMVGLRYRWSGARAGGREAT